jgi:hypothetical protein
VAEARPVFTLFEGEEICDEELALAELLAAGVLFWNTGRFDEEETVVLFVNCNDLFAWGCADAEPFTSDEIPDLYRAWKSGPWGVDKWCGRRRNQEPQEPVVKRMKAEGVWDAAMEALGTNTLDAETRAHIAAVVGAPIEKAVVVPGG